jgi:hypothetical protein
LGVAFLPAGVASMFIGKDSTAADFDKGYDAVYDTSLKVMREIGQVSKEDRAGGTIAGKVSGCDINIKIAAKTQGKVSVNITARKYMMPKANIASGILYQIEEKLK